MSAELHPGVCAQNVAARRAMVVPRKEEMNPRRGDRLQRQQRAAGALARRCPVRKAEWMMRDQRLEDPGRHLAEHPPDPRDLLERDPPVLAGETPRGIEAEN